MGGALVLLHLDSLNRLIESVGHKRTHSVDVVCWAEASDGEVALCGNCGFPSAHEFLELTLRGVRDEVMIP